MLAKLLLFLSTASVLTVLAAGAPSSAMGSGLVPACAATVQGATHADARYPQKSIFEEADREQIGEWLSNAGTPGRDKWARVVDLYIDRRVAFLPEENRADVASLLRQFSDRRLSFVDDSNVYRADSSEIILPNVLRDLGLPSLILVHELEHVVQMYFDEQARGVDPASRVLAHLRNLVDAKGLFFEERDAMSAEHELARLIPAGMIRHALVVIENLGLSKESKIVFSRMYTEAHRSREDYLANEHGQGRYSRASTVELKTKQFLKEAGLVTLFGGAAFEALAHVCGLSIFFGG